MGPLDPALLRQTHERATTACSVLQLNLGNVIRYGLTGNWLGKEAGSSIDFHDHRAYLPGDDPRHIDWRVFARTDHYVMKQFREEISPSVDLIVDLSASMSLTQEKLRRTFELLYFSLESALAGQASVRTLLLGRSGARRIETAALHRYSVALAEGKEPQPMPVLLRETPLRRSSLRILISDLLFRDSPRDVLNELVARNGSAMIFVPFSKTEADPGWTGSIEFTDCESAHRREQIVDDELLARYLGAYRAHFEAWRQSCRRFRVPCVQVGAEQDLLEALRVQSFHEGAVRLWG